MIALPKSIRTLVAATLICSLLGACSEAARTSRTLERAERAFKAGEYDKARIDYMAVLRTDSRNATAVQRLGQIWSEAGAPMRAMPFLLKARELDPGDSASRNRLAQALFAFGQLGEARKEAIAVLKQAPADTDALLVLASTTAAPEHFAETEQALRDFPAKDTAAYHVAAGNVAARRGDPATAEAELRQAVALDQKSPLAHLAMSLLLAARGEKEKAVEELKTASDLAPVRSNERIRYAELLATTGDIEKAEAVATETSKAAPDFLPAWRLLAQIALYSNKPDEALKRLENVFSRDPQDIEGGLLQAQALLAKGDAKQAIERLETANASYQGQVPIVKYRLAEAYARDNNRDKAIALLHEVVAADPNYVEPALALADLNLRAGNAAPVVGPMTDLLQKRGDLPQVRMLLAGAYQQLGQFDEAIVLLQEQIKRFPMTPEPHLLLGTVLRRQNKIAEAREALQRAVELSPGNLQPLAALIDLEISEGNFPAALDRARQVTAKHPRSAAGPFFEARVHFAQQNWDAAEAALQKTIELDPNAGDAYGLLVSTYLAANRLPQAAARLEEITRGNTSNTQAAMALALVHEKLRDFPKAAEAYEKVIANTPDSAAALNNLAYIYTEHLNQPQKAVELARRARALQPGDAPIADTLGWALFKQQDYPQALALFQESAPKLADVPDAQFHLGMASYMMGRRDEAKAAFERALASGKDFAGKDEAQRRIALLESGGGGGDEQPVGRDALEKLVAEQPADVIGWMRLADAYERERQFAKAAEAYEKARALNPNLLPANLKLAQLYAGPLKDNEKAIAVARKARELAPGDAEAAAVLGRVAFQSGNFTWALSLLQESARRSGDKPDLLYDLARTQYAVGKTADSRDTMQRLVGLSPQAPQAEVAKRFLQMTSLEEPSAEAVAAEADVRGALQAQGDDVPALMAQAAIHRQRGDGKSAAATYARVLQIYPDFAPAQKRLAAIYAETPDDLTKAYELATKARRTLPDDADLTRTLAEINFQRKDFPAAVQMFQQSARKAPLPAKELYHLGIAQLETKREAEGRQTIQRAIAEGLQPPLVDEAHRRLAETEPK
jgi:tetratricopeptide (TPR) repeat protein